ncbi:MAG: cell division protein FtsZ [Bacteroidota bacterium]
MSDTGYSFDIPKQNRSIIKVIGVGGGGSNAVNHMYNQGIKDVEFVICNTDAQALKTSPVPLRLQIGTTLTQGLGAGANPEKGKNAALESKEEIRDILDDGTKMVFITAGMGGGTGTGAAPILAKVAREMDILTVGIVTVPFGFEGKKKMRQAEAGVDDLKANCDTVLVILNDKLREIHGNLTIGNAFAKADNVLTTAAKGIAEIITVAGYVNVDFEDVRTVMQNAGAAVMGSAQTEGDNRAIRAAEDALASPLLNSCDILGAEKILLSIVSGDQSELQMDELTEITEYIQDQAGDEAEVIFGHGVDPELGQSIRVTVIATGFEDKKPSEMMADQDDVRKVIDLESQSQIELFHADNSVNDAPQEITKKTVDPPTTPSIPEREYSFDMEMRSNFNEPAEEDEGEDGLFAGLEDEFEIVNKVNEPSDHFEPKQEEKEEQVNDRFADTRERMRKQAMERIEKLKGISKSEWSADEFREKLDVPAYMRKEVRLDNVPHSSERNISKYNLNDDNEILGNNKFLHDNVD